MFYLFQPRHGSTGDYSFRPTAISQFHHRSTDKYREKDVCYHGSDRCSQGGERESLSVFLRDYGQVSLYICLVSRSPEYYDIVFPLPYQLQDYQFLLIRSRRDPTLSAETPRMLKFDSEITTSPSISPLI